MEFRGQDEEIAMPSSLGYAKSTVRSSAFSQPSLSPSSSLVPPRGLEAGLGAAPAVIAADSGNGSPFASPMDSQSQPPAVSTRVSYPPPAAPVHSNNSDAAGVRYHECLRNHAAALGSHVVDGCGEFMPAADDPLKCAACGCHRSFHRKDSAEGDSAAAAAAMAAAANSYHHHGRAVSAGAQRLPLLLPPPHLYPHRAQKLSFHPGGFSPSPSRAAPLAFGGVNTSPSGGTTTESSSEERLDPGAPPPPPGATAASRKRFRTKFTPDQKERMLSFAERVGWRFQKQDETLVEQFCAEVGIRRQVLKVWMHNNKHTIRKQQLQHPQEEQQNQQQSQHQQLP